MKTMTWESLFGPITGKRDPRKKLGKPFTEWRTLEEDTYFDGYTYAKGSKYRVFESADFGYVIFNTDSKTPEGNTPARFIHRF